LNNVKRALFVPPVIQQVFSLGRHDRRIFDKFAGNWWEDHAVFKYPQLLISYKYKIDNKVTYDDLRKNYRIPDDVRVFCDSGAFTAVSRKIELDPKDVFDWQRRNGNIAFILDEIPADVQVASAVGKQNYKQFGLDEFSKKADQTARNCEAVFKMRGSDTFPKIYGITHGIPIRNILTNEYEDLYEYWFNRLKDFPFDGWGTGFKPVHNPLLQALALMKLYDKGVRSNIHLLGVAAAKSIPVMVWATRYIDDVTFDGTRYGHGAMTRMYFYPDKISKLRFWGEKIYQDPVRGIYNDHINGRLNCDCYICETVIREHGNLLYYNEPGSLAGVLLSLHNILAHTRLVESYQAALNDKNAFLSIAQQHVNDHSYKEIKYAIDFMDDCVAHGFDKTYSKYISAGFDFGLRKGKAGGTLDFGT